MAFNRGNKERKEQIYSTSIAIKPAAAKYVYYGLTAIIHFYGCKAII